MTPVPVFSCPRSRACAPAARRALLTVTAAAALLLPAAGLRAQSPGSQDASFNAGPIAATVYAVDYETIQDQADKITVGGDRFYGGYIDGTGLLRTDFVFPDFGNAARIVYTVVPERVNNPDFGLPNLLLGGNFNRGTQQIKNGVAAQNIIRIAPDGTQDMGFVAAVGTGANNFVTSILPLEDGRIVVGGLFTKFNRAHAATLRRR